MYIFGGRGEAFLSQYALGQAQTTLELTFERAKLIQLRHTPAIWTDKVLQEGVKNRVMPAQKGENSSQAVRSFTHRQSNDIYSAELRLKKHAANRQITNLPPQIKGAMISRRRQ